MLLRGDFNMTKLSFNDPIATQAANWMALLRSERATEADRRAYLQWLAADLRHATVGAGLERALGTFQASAQAGVSGEVIDQALKLSGKRRQVLQGGLLLLGLGGVAAVLVDRETPLLELAADLRTGTGQRRSVGLVDGSTVILNARSAADIDFDAQQRLLHLRSGELLARVALDHRRPFVVRTEHGAVRALGTAFVLRREADYSEVSVLSSRVEIATRDGVRQRLSAGQSARFDRGGISAMSARPEAESAWVDGLLEVNDRPLAQVISAIRPYRSGVIRVAQRAAQLRVSGVFPLDDTDLALSMLTQTLPIRIQRSTPYWVSISMA